MFLIVVAGLLLLVALTVCAHTERDIVDTIWGEPEDLT